MVGLFLTHLVFYLGRKYILFQKTGGVVKLSVVCLFLMAKVEIVFVTTTYKIILNYYLEKPMHDLSLLFDNQCL